MPRVALACATALALSIALAPPAPRPAEAQPADALLQGVQRIAAPGVPGPLCVYGERARSVVVGGGGGAARLPVVAAGPLGAGMVVAFGHGGYLDTAALQTADTGRLLENAVRAVARDAANARVGALGAAGAAGYLRDRGFAVDAIGFDALAGHDVILFVPWNESPEQIAALAAHVRAGNGLVVAATGWGWAQLHPARDLQTEYAGNRLLAAAGIQWPNDWLSETAAEGGYDVPGTPSTLTTAPAALAAAKAHEDGSRPLTPAEVEQVSRTLVMNAACVPPDDTSFLPQLRAATSATIVPSPADPVTRVEILDRLAVVMQTRALDALPVEQAVAHPAADLFPGAVPVDAPRVARAVAIDRAAPEWHSTGLYAAPGEIVTVRIPDDAVGDGLGLRIGAHTDTLWGTQDDWTRMPEVTRAWPLTAPETRVFSPFGGLVYVTVPSNGPKDALSVTIEGAVEAPLFLAGRTDPTDWRERVRDLPAPWAEVGSGKMIVTVPSALVRDLEDPAAVAAAWDRIIDLDAELATWPGPRARAERFVTDQQIAYGYMHAGYPLMCFLDQSAHLVDAVHITTEGNWGFFHEVGHNHQSGDWTFGGTGEVTVNLFTLYTYEQLVGIPVLANERGSVEFVRAQMAKMDWQQPSFERWKSDPFLALSMYIQLQHAFGWEAYRRVFAEYRDLPADERPKTDDEKRDQWLVRFSRTVGRDLGPFLEAWGVPTSPEARASLADLPPWMPKGFPPDYELDVTPTPTATDAPTAAPPAATATPTGEGGGEGARLYLPWAGHG